MSARESEYGFAKRRIDEVRVVELIAVTTAEGEGSPDDPVHLHTRYYTPAGNLVAETPRGMESDD